MNTLGQFPASSLWQEPSPDFAKLAQENAEARGQLGPDDVSETPAAGPNLTPWIMGGLAVAVLFMFLGAPAGKRR